MDALRQFEKDTGYKIINWKYNTYDIPNFNIELLKDNICVIITKNITHNIKYFNDHFEEIIIEIIKEVSK